MQKNEKPPAGQAIRKWTFAGLMITDWCSAACPSCYLSCNPSGQRWMSVNDAVRFWRELCYASPTGCKIHITGGEAFGDFDRLAEIAIRVKSLGVGRLEKVETNAYWATDEDIVRQRIKILIDAGMEKLTISADPYHQRYVPIERCRLAAKVADEMLGKDRVQVRWRDWLANGVTTAGMTDDEFNALLKEYLVKRRDRINGRAAAKLAPLLTASPPETFADADCFSQLPGSKHIHIAPDGEIIPGVCAGIILGVADEERSISQIWQEMADGWQDRPVLGTLSAGGPYKLMQLARQFGFVPSPAGYVSKCHLCYEVRRWLYLQEKYHNEIGPGNSYAPPPK